MGGAIIAATSPFPPWPPNLAYPYAVHFQPSSHAFVQGRATCTSSQRPQWRHREWKPAGRAAGWGIELRVYRRALPAGARGAHLFQQLALGAIAANDEAHVWVARAHVRQHHRQDVNALQCACMRASAGLWLWRIGNASTGHADADADAADDGRGGLEHAMRCVRYTRAAGAARTGAHRNAPPPTQPVASLLKREAPTACRGLRDGCGAAGCVGCFCVQRDGVGVPKGEAHLAVHEA